MKSAQDTASQSAQSKVNAQSKATHPTRTSFCPLQPPPRQKRNQKASQGPILVLASAILRQKSCHAQFQMFPSGRSTPGRRPRTPREEEEGTPTSSTGQRQQRTIPEVELRANLEPIPHRCHLFEAVFVWKLTKDATHLPLGCLQGGHEQKRRGRQPHRRDRNSKAPGYLAHKKHPSRRTLQ